METTVGVYWWVAETKHRSKEENGDWNCKLSGLAELADSRGDVIMAVVGGVETTSLVWSAAAVETNRCSRVKKGG